MEPNKQPSSDELLSALENAHLKGDTAAATEFANWHQELYAPKEPEAKDYDSFADASGKAVSNVPERFQQSAAGIVQLFAEDMKQGRDRHIEQRAQAIGIKPEDYRLLGWAGREGLIDTKMPIPEALQYVKKNLVGSLDDQQRKQVVEMGIINLDDMTAFAEDWRRETQATMVPVNAEPGSMADYGSQAIGSMAEMGPAIVASMLSRSPAAAMRIMTGQVGGESYARGREEGLTPDQAKTYALATSAAEVIPSAIPISALIKPGQEILTRMRQAGITEAVQESFTAALQAGIDQQIITPEMTWEEASQRIIDGGIVGFIAGTGTAAAVHPIDKAQQAVSDKFNSPERMLSQSLDQEVKNTQFAAPADQLAAQALDPANAQMQQQPTQSPAQSPLRKSMAELVAEKLAQRTGAPAADYTPQQVAMPDNVNVPFDVPAQPVVDAAPSEVAIPENVNAPREIAGQPVVDEDREIIEQAPVIEQQEIGQAPVIEDSPQAPAYAEGVERVVHTTKKGREIPGVIDYEITLDDAKEIDAYAFAKNGGVFIRENRIQEYNQKRSVDNASVDTDGIGQGSDQPQGSRDDGRALDQGEPRPGDNIGSDGGSRAKALPLADANKRNDDALTAEIDKPVAKASVTEKAIPKRADTENNAPAITEPRPKKKTGSAESDVSAMAAAAMPMKNYRPMYESTGVPARASGDMFTIGDRVVKLKPAEKPTRKEGIKVMVIDIIGPTLYEGKIKGKATLGFHRGSTGEVRTAKQNDVEVMAHEMAHYLDKHYSFSGRFTDAYKDKAVEDEVTSLSYTSDPAKMQSEGFAEFVRLWLTNYDQAIDAAPNFTKKLEEVLAGDPPLNKKMRKLQEEMHRWYKQGPAAQLTASSGKELTLAQEVTLLKTSMPTERTRQNLIDKYHAATVVERTLTGTLGDATVSAAKQFQMVNGAESVHESTMKWGTPSLQPDGTFEFSGKGLTAVFEPVAKHGYKRFNLLMDYFKARRADELMKQGREKSLTKQQIKAGLDYAVKYPEFVEVFEDFQKFNKRMVTFYVQMGLITQDQATAFEEANKSYVPFHRVIESMEDGADGGSSPIGQRLLGSDKNTRDIAVNIVEGLYANIRGAMIARAKQTMFTDIMKSKDGAIFAAKIGTDSKLVKAHVDQMAKTVAQAMAEVGIAISKDGMIVAGDIDGKIVDVKDIEESLQSNPELLNFWTFGHPPTTTETYVDSAIINGKQVWFEVHNQLLVDMLSGMKGFRAGAIISALITVKNIQTRAVTSMVQFLGGNFARDTVSGYVLSKNRFIPVYTTLVGMRHTIMQSEEFKQFMLHGGGYGTRIEARTEETRKRRQLDLPSKDVFDVAAKFLAGMDRVTSVFEYGTRVGDFVLGQKTKNKLEAAWEGREISTDFSKIGLNKEWSTFLRTVPFMNAGIQGLDKTSKEFAQIDGEMKAANLLKMTSAKARFLAAGGSLTIMSVIMWMINEDDERYNALTDDEKARFTWFFPKDGSAPYKVPKAYDVSFIFQTIPEQTLEYIKNRDGADAAKTLGWALIHTLAVGDYPGLLQPMIEVKSNEKFTGAPVVPEKMRNVEKRYQYDDRTPLLYVKLGRELNISPKVAEHYTKGYLRYVEQMIADASEAYLWDEEKWGERPFTRGPVDYVTHQFVGKKVPYRTKWTEGYYDLKNRAQGAAASMRLRIAEAIRDKEQLNEFTADKVNMTLSNLGSTFAAIDKSFQDSEMIIASYKYNKELTKEQKEQKIESYYKQKNDTYAKAYKQINDEINEVEAAIHKEKAARKQ